MIGSNGFVEDMAGVDMIVVDADETDAQVD